jgi:hypothetical protein
VEEICVPVPRQKCANLQDKVDRLVGGIILIFIHSIELIHNLKSFLLK